MYFVGLSNVMKQILGIIILLGIIVLAFGKAILWILGVALIILIIIALLNKNTQNKPKKTASTYETYQQKRIADAQKKVKELEEQINTGFKNADEDKIPKFIFIDFETTGLPPFYTMPEEDLIDKFPFSVQVACLVFNRNAELIDEYCSIINPGEVNFQPGVENIHGISKEKANKEGVPILDFLNFFVKYKNAESVIIAHNVQFDNLILKLEAKRNNIKLGRYKTFCTMKSTVREVGIEKEFGSGYKYPKLKELVEHTFTNGYEIDGINLHDASIDVKLCALCFFEKKMDIDFI